MSIFYILHLDITSRQTKKIQHQQLRQSGMTYKNRREMLNVFKMKNEKEASNQPSTNVINPIENGTNLGNENTSLTNLTQHTKVNNAVKNDDKLELMQTRLSETPDIRHIGDFDNTKHKKFDQIQHLNGFSSLQLNVPVSPRTVTVNRNEPDVTQHKFLDYQHNNIATSHQKTKEALQSTTRDSILKTRKLLVTESTAKEKTSSVSFSVKNRIQVRHFFREGGNFPDMFYFKNNKRKEKELVILCDTAKYFVLISLLIISIVILSLMFFGVCLILNYKFPILKRNIIYSIRFLKTAFEKKSKCSYKDYSIELTYYTTKLQTGEKVYESSEPFI